jgi:hypothetical protein
MTDCLSQLQETASHADDEPIQSHVYTPFLLTRLPAALWAGDPHPPISRRYPGIIEGGVGDGSSCSDGDCGAGHLLGVGGNAHTVSGKDTPIVRRLRTPVGPRLIVLFLVLLAAAPLGTAAQTRVPSVEPALPSFSHVFVIVLENREYGDVIGNPALPYLNDLAQRYGLATASYAVSHPSLPNYLALTGGDTFGVTSDCTNCFVKAPNLVDQLESAGKSWKAYMDGMPSPCFLGNKGQYAQKHNPFIYYDDVRTDAARCDKLVPFTNFADDLAAQTVPNFVWITPDQCHDLHSCPDAQGDAWLKTWVPQILASSAWKQGGVLFITFDEGATDASCCGGSGGGHVATLVISPLGLPGAQSTTPLNHYGLLRTIEDAWGLPHLGAAANAAPMNDFFPTNATPPAA